MADYFQDCSLGQYADDTQMMISSKIDKINTLTVRAETLLIRAKTYFSSNGLLLNEAKTQCIFLGVKQYISRIPEDICIKFGNLEIIPSNNVKNLGIYMDNTMNFKYHIDEMSKRVKGVLYYMSRVCERFEKKM